VSIFWSYLRFRVLLWALRMAGRLLAFAVVVAVLVAAAPVTLVTAVGLAGRGCGGGRRPGCGGPPAGRCR
jgi:hypothetical protein